MQLGRALVALALLTLACGGEAPTDEAGPSSGGGGKSGSGGALGGAAGTESFGGSAGATSFGGSAGGEPSDAGADAPATDDGGDVDGGAGVDGGDAGAPLDVCSGVDDGKYCGGVIGGAKSSLYTCSAESTAATKVCANGCFNGKYSDACESPCCLKKPPGTIPNLGGWDACPYSGSGREHSAIDFSSAKGTPIPAGMDGTIQFIRYQDDPKCYVAGKGCTASCLASGDYVVLKAACGDPKKPNNDLFVRYFHINGVRKGLKVGDKVVRGDVIAYVGESGCATGPHVHLQTATFAKGKYAVGKAPLFGDCASTVNPATRFCQ